MTADPYRRVLDDFDNQAKQITSWGSDDDERETLRLLRDAIGRFAERHIDEARIDAEGEIPPEVLRAAADMGLFGISIAHRYGGSGLSMKACCSVIEQLGQVDRSVGVSIGLHAGLGLRGLNHLGSERLKETYLPKLARGEQVACFSITEADAGSDIASMRTTALQDGDELVINGSKLFVTNGGFAHLATIVARTPGLGGSRRGHSMLLVPLDSRGVRRDAEENKLGLKGSSTRGLHFEDVRIPLDHLLGSPSRGLDQLQFVLAWGRTLMGAGCAGLARAAMQRSLEQVTQRRQFKRMIAEFGMVREKLAWMRTQVHAMESLLRLVCRLEDERPGSIMWESSVAKIFCTEASWQCADEALQLHGGLGFIEDAGVARLLRDCRIGRIFEGANDLLRYHMASAAFTWKPQADDGNLTLAARMGDLLGDEARSFDEMRRRLDELTQTEKKTHGLKVFKRQMVQHRLADAAIDLYALLAVLLRAKGEERSGTLDEPTLLWARHAAHDLRKRIEHNFERQRDHADELASQIAAAECERIGFPLQETVA